MIAAYSRNTIAGARRIARERGQALPPRLSAQKSHPVPRAILEPKHVPSIDPHAEVLSAIRKMQKRGMPKWARDIVIDVAERRGFRAMDLIGISRRHPIVSSRNEAFYLIRAEVSPVTGNKPSWPRIAEWFDRNHTGILYGASKHAYVNDLPSPSSWDVETKMSERRERAAAYHEKRRGR